MTYDNAEDFLIRAQESTNSFDNEGRKVATRQFIDEKAFKTGRGAYDKSKAATKFIAELAGTVDLMHPDPKTKAASVYHGAAFLSHSTLYPPTPLYTTL